MVIYMECERCKIKIYRLGGYESLYWCHKCGEYFGDE